MKIKKLLALSMSAVMMSTLAACSGSADEADKAPAKEEAAVETDGQEAAGSEEASETGLKSYADIVLGEDFTDLQAEISFFNNRTDLDSEDYGGVRWVEYMEEFNKTYPGIKVNVITDTNYAEDAKTHLQSGDYETVMMIPSIDKSDLSSYFESFGSLDVMNTQINYADHWEYKGEVYGVPSTATAQGIVYNKRVFEEAGVTELPKTPDEFIAALKKIKEYNSDIIPLYTNYAAGWTMGSWDDYTGVSATGDAAFTNNTIIHTTDPFKNYEDGTHPYAVYKILYDAVAEGLTEEDYSTTDWEGCKGMINRGEIGCMVLGSWAYPQMEAAGENAADIGYMPFPISVDGKQYALAGPDYCYGVNVNAPENEKQAALVFVKWMTEESGFAYNEDGLPIKAGSTETKLAFDNVEFMQETPALEGEEDLLNELNSESEMNFRAGGDRRVQLIIEHASMGDMTFDEIMDDWNQKWTDAQDVLGIERN
ncbi:ABC transporter substrate-binding protein [Butyrivibrio sp. MC2013]|uniref:ABC transporter substrate-binding protein n=1 Tax=Butyrivibrio sp. MC2013 TaxID=1280686 RepID=UPI000422F0E2|nr:extracellular solute-binding protein [Butyrivibrio sp. MC2013]